LELFGFIDKNVPADQPTVLGASGVKANNCCPAQYDQHNNVLQLRAAFRSEKLIRWSRLIHDEMSTKQIHEASAATSIKLR
jgi:hypothetical protein